MSSSFDWSQFEEVPQKTIDWSQFEEVNEKPTLSFPKLGFSKKTAGESKIPSMKRLAGRSAKVVGSTIAGLPGDIAGQLGEGMNWLAKHVPGGSPKSEEELAEITQNPFTSESISRGIEKIVPTLVSTSPEEKEWEENLSLLTSLATPIPLGKAKAIDPRKLSRLYKAGKQLGLTEKELTPLLQGRVKTDLLGKFAKKTEALKDTLKMTEGRLSDVYTSIKETASKFPPLHADETTKLIDEFRKVRTGLEKTLSPSPDKQAAMNFIDTAIEKADRMGTSPEELINFYQDINQAVNWNAIKGGKKTLEHLKDPITKTLQHASPSLARRFSDTNLLWSKMKGFEKQIGIPKIQKYIDYGEIPAFLAQVSFGNYKKAAAIGGGIAARRVATKLLTDPNWQNLHNKILTSIKNANPKAAATLLQVLKEKTKKELPEDYDEIEWPSP